MCLHTDLDVGIAIRSAALPRQALAFEEQTLPVHRPRRNGDIERLAVAQGQAFLGAPRRFQEGHLGLVGDVGAPHLDAGALAAAVEIEEVAEEIVSEGIVDPDIRRARAAARASGARATPGGIAPAAETAG